MTSQAHIDSAIAKIRSIVGESGWLHGADATPLLIDFRADFSGSALGVVRPRTTAEVAAIVAACADAGLVVVAQGGNSGLSGGSVPHTDRPVIVLSLSLMRIIEDVNPEQFSMTVQAGVTIEEMHEAAAAVERLFAPDWGARGTATIGGGIATNAGGINVLRYGTMRDQVLGLEVVLADGRIWNGLRALPKDNSGYDLKQLFIASEGTLGIVTRATVRLHPRPAEEHTAFAALSDAAALNEMFSLARSGTPGALSAFELVPELGVGRVIERYGARRPLPDVSDWYVLLRFSGSAGTSEALTALLSEATARGIVSDAVVATSRTQEENLWHIRDELPPPRIFDGYMVKYDLAVPPDQIGAFHTEVATLIDELVPGAMPYVFGHVGDGNLHLTVWPAESADGLLEERKSDLVSAIDRLVWDFNGTISAEHGIGQELVERLPGQKPSVELDLMRSIKQLFDPADILNPGTILPAEAPATVPE